MALLRFGSGRYSRGYRLIASWNPGWLRTLWQWTDLVDWRLSRQRSSTETRWPDRGEKRHCRGRTRPACHANVHSDAYGPGDVAHEWSRAHRFGFVLLRGQCRTSDLPPANF